MCNAILQELEECQSVTQASIASKNDEKHSIERFLNMKILRAAQGISRHFHLRIA